MYWLGSNARRLHITVNIRNNELTADKERRALEKKNGGSDDNKRKQKDYQARQGAPPPTQGASRSGAILVCVCLLPWQISM